MAYQTPIDQPLTTIQSELISKIGSMKNLLSLSFVKKFQIPKGEQISTFDYIIKTMRAMGIDPAILLKSFINQFLTTSKLVEFILRGSAQLAAGINLNLDPNSSLIIDTNSTKEEKKEIIDINFAYLNNNTLIKDSLISVVEGLRMQLIKDLMTLIFGAPKKPAGVAIMGENQVSGRMDELISEISCGAEIFSVSNSTNKRNEDIEYNRISLKKKGEAGKIAFKITCQGIEIKFPENPGYLFSEAPPGMVSSNLTTPEQALTNCINHVANQTQKAASGGGQSNSSASQKSFTQMLLEKLITHIVVLLKPFFLGVDIPIPGTLGNLSLGYRGILAEIQNALFAQGRMADANNFNPIDIFPPSSCEIISNWDSSPELWSGAQKKKSLLLIILCNMALNAALGFLISYLLDKIKKFIVSYKAKRAINKYKRKLEKIKQKLLGGETKAKVIAENAKKAVKQAKILEIIKPALNIKSNSFI